MSDTAISVRVEQMVSHVARVKSAGTVYTPRYSRVWEPVTTCALTPGSGIRTCPFTPQSPGTYRAVSQVVDAQQRSHDAEIQFWVAGEDSVVWETPENGSLSVVAERTRLRLGETARFLVRNPFPGAFGLVTVERYGVLRSWVERFDTATPVIKVPVTPNMVPGFFLSVTVVSPRIGQPLVARPGEENPKRQLDPQHDKQWDPNADLGMPTMRMGYVRCTVTDPAKELALSVTTDKPVYRPGEAVTVTLAHTTESSRLEARTEGQGSAAEPVEVAIAVIDESVLALNRHGLAHYDAGAGLVALGELDVRNFNLLGQLVGRQRLEAKGASSGGGGTSEGLRSNFRHLAHWTGAMKLDAHGQGRITLQAPDNLTGWRILVLALTRDDRFGLSQGHFKVNRPTELRPILPNQVSLGDKFRAGFSIFNRTDHDRTLDVTVASSSAHDRNRIATENHRSLRLSARERRAVWLDVEANHAGGLVLRASAGDRHDRDRIEAEVKVRDIIQTVSMANFSHYHRAGAPRGSVGSERVADRRRRIAYPNLPHGNRQSWRRIPLPEGLPLCLLGTTADQGTNGDAIRLPERPPGNQCRLARRTLLTRQGAAGCGAISGAQRWDGLLGSQRSIHEPVPERLHRLSVRMVPRWRAPASRHSGRPTRRLSRADVPLGPGTRVRRIRRRLVAGLDGHRAGGRSSGVGATG